MNTVHESLLERLDAGKLNRCSDMLKAMAHPVRLSIIDLLRGGRRLTVTEIYEKLELEQAVASHHLGILRNKGLLHSERHGKNTIYSLAMPQLQQIITCVENCNTA